MILIDKRLVFHLHKFDSDTENKSCALKFIDYVPTEVVLK